MSRIPLSTPYERALDAIGLMRRERLSLTAAAGRAGTRPAIVVKYAGAALEIKGGRYVATEYDTLPRRMNFLFEDGPRWVTVRDSRAASLMSEHATAVKRYLADGDEDGLFALEGSSVLIGDERVELITDPATLDRLANAGELHYELYRR